MNFRQYPGKEWSQILSTSDVDALDLVQNLVVLESSRRLNASAAVSHPYLK